MATRLRVAAYNVLAQVLAKSDYFPYAGGALKLKQRWPQLQRVLESLDADVICLSELDRVEEDYRPWLAARGYALVYKRRGAKQYGNGIAYRTAKLELVAAACADLNDLADAVSCGVAGTEAWHVVQGHHAADDSAGTIAARFRRDSVCVYAALRLVGHPQRLGVVVGCTHTYWDPSMSVVRSAQAAAVLLGAAEFAGAVAAQERAPTPWPVIVGGDFNSQPGTDAHRLLIRTPLPLLRAPPPAIADATTSGHEHAAAGGAAAAAASLGWDSLQAGPPAAAARPAPTPAAGAVAAVDSGASSVARAATAASSLEGPAGAGAAAAGSTTSSSADAPLHAARQQWLTRLSAFVARAVRGVTTRHRLQPSSDSTKAEEEEEEEDDDDDDEAAEEGAWSGPTLVSAYAAHARSGMALRAVAPVDAAARTVCVVPEGLPRAQLPLRHGAPAVALPLVLPLAATAGGGERLLHAGAFVRDGGGGGDDTESGARLALGVPRAAALALDVLAEPAMTTCTQAFTEALDYVLVTPRVQGPRGGAACLVEVAGVLAMPSMDDVTEGGKVVAAPSLRHPSDHFPLVADLNLHVEGVE